jgi:hypothetical protein
MEILIWILIFWVGWILGFLAKAWLAYRLGDYSGTIIVSKESGKTMYSLVLDDYPEKLEFRKVVVFKVEAPEEGFDRD